MVDKTLKKKIGKAIAYQRDLKGFKQDQVAEYLKVETETVSRLETGVITPTLKRLAQFSEMYDCPITAFFQKASVNLSSQAQTIADMLQPLTKEERQLVVNIVEEVTKLVTSRKG